MNDPNIQLPMYDTMQTCILYTHVYSKLDTYPSNRLGFDAAVKQVRIVYGVGQLGNA